MFSVLDPAHAALPKVFAEQKVTAIEQLKKYFHGVSHHSFPPTNEEFERKLTELEDLLIQELEPRTFDDFAQIDSLVLPEK